MSPPPTPPQVTILFTDICGFTDMSKQVEPVEVMHFLNCLYSRYDLLLNEWGVYKVRPGGQGGGGFTTCCSTSGGCTR